MSNFVSRFLAWLQDRVMFALLGAKIIYNVSWEDPRVDRALMDIDEDSKICMLTSAGDNVLDYILAGAKQVVAVDLNPQQNSLLELKLAASRVLSYEEFFALWSASTSKGERESIVAAKFDAIRNHLSPQARLFWDGEGRRSVIDGIHGAGMSGMAAKSLMFIARLLWLGGLIDGVKLCDTLGEQRAVYAQYSGRLRLVFRILHMTRRIWCPLIAVPASQLDLSDGNIVERAMDNLFMNTHIAKDNYFFHGYFYGQYTTECCPEYLKRENFEALRAGVSRVRVEYGTLKEGANRYDDEHFTHFVLLDHMDWMSNAMILDEWEVFVKKGSRDCKYLWRSFAEHQHIAPLNFMDFQKSRVAEVLSRIPDRVGMYNTTWFATKPDNIVIVNRQPYAPPATLQDDLQVLWANFVSPIKGTSHEDRLASFYAGQAQVYDKFRHRFLHGRQPMAESMPAIKDGVWVDLGGGTAANLEYMRDAIDDGVWSQVYVLDLCKPLLDVAEARVSMRGWEDTVTLVHGDATDQGLLRELTGTVDVVTFSYSLTMIPDWRAALQNAYRLLKPGGYLCVADFTVTKKHSAVTQTFWPAVFANDHVHLNTDHLPTLRAMFDAKHWKVQYGGFPYIPLLKCPYYVFVGQRPADDNHKSHVHYHASIRIAQGHGLASTSTGEKREARLLGSSMSARDLGGGSGGASVDPAHTWSDSEGDSEGEEEDGVVHRKGYVVEDVGEGSAATLMSS